MTKKRREFTKSFKLEVIQARLLGASISDVARRYQVSESMVSRWQTEYQEFGEQAFPGPGRPLEDQVSELERVLGQVVMENAFLKKALQRLVKVNR